MQKYVGLNPLQASSAVHKLAHDRMALPRCPEERALCGHVGMYSQSWQDAR